MDEPIYCIFCDAEATTMYEIIEGAPAPMCESHAEAFEMGQENFEALEIDISEYDKYSEYDEEVV